MLGKRVEAIIDDSYIFYKNSKDRYMCRANICNFKDVNNKHYVYYLGNKVPENKTLCVVSAILEYNGFNVLVLTNPGFFSYEPEIITSLLFFIKEKPEKVNCLYEKSCGVVVYLWENRRLLFLLIKNKKAWHWAFPKGHIEENETERQTAQREVFEETGLNVDIVNGFRQTCEYRPFGSVKKHVVLFLGKSKSKIINIQEEEIDGFSWVDFKTALRMFRHENDRRVIKKARSWILKNDNLMEKS